jgi:tetraacyldisaccharide 4'-kinase
MRLRNLRYDLGRNVHVADVPVVSVGNLTLGGTGKTPLVAWIARWLRQRDVRVTIVSRGYGAQRGEPNDEALELEQRLPDVPHLQNADRVAATQTAIEEFDCQVVLLDDGFQHRRLARDLDIVLLDACEPFGFGHVFPRGLLREPVAGLKRADIVVLSRADMVSPEQRAQIRGEVARHAPLAAWVEVRHAPERWLSSTGDELPVAALAGKPLAAFCGLGNPAGFRHTLGECDGQVQAFREFPDHHLYDRSDVESLAAWAAQLNVTAVACTHKDLVKLELDRLGEHPLWALVIGIEILAGQDELEQQLATLLPWTEGQKKKEVSAEAPEERKG